MPGLFADSIDAATRAQLFDAVEHAAAEIGLGVFVVQVSPAPPTVVFASEMLARLVGRPLAELIGGRPWDLAAPHERDRIRSLISSRGPGAPPLALSVEIAHPDGRVATVEAGIARINTDTAILAVCYFRDVTEQRATVTALQRSEQRFRAMIEKAPDGVVILREGRIVLANPIGARMLGTSEPESLRGRMITEFLPTEDGKRAMERIGRIIATGKDLGSSEYTVTTDGSSAVEIHSIPCDWEGAPAILSFARDVTERNKLQRELERAVRLAAVGTMAATVAHEINNPLTYVQLSLQRLERELAADPANPRDAALRDHVRNAMHGAERVATIVRDLRSYARDDDSSPGPVDVVAVVERGLKMVEHDLRHRARLVRRFDGVVPAVDAVASRLEQVVVNLMINAIQALPEGDATRDEITIEVRATVAPAAPGVVIAVRDTGIGISDADRAHVFEPFFTTKPHGEGTGLGLAVCKRIVEGMGGQIAITSAPGAGTEVTVTLPAMAMAARAAHPIEPATAARRRLQVLVIDDEPLVRKVIRMSLAPHHDVEDVAGGDAALALLAGRRFDAILCDLMMPGMSGREVYTRIRECHPGLERRIVLITGGAFVPTLADFLESVDNLKLLKPFTEEEVVAAVQAASSR